jgi:hypothetical protein
LIWSRELLFLGVRDGRRWRGEALVEAVQSWSAATEGGSLLYWMGKLETLRTTG